MAATSVPDKIAELNTYFTAFDSWAKIRDKPEMSRWQRFFTMQVNNITISRRSLGNVTKLWSQVKGDNEKISASAITLSNSIQAVTEMLKSMSPDSKALQEKVNAITKEADSLENGLIDDEKKNKKLLLTIRDIIIAEIDNVKLFVGKDNEKKFGEMRQQIQNLLTSLKGIVTRLAKGAAAAEAHLTGSFTIATKKKGVYVEERLRELNLGALLGDIGVLIKDIMDIYAEVDASTQVYIAKMLDDFRKKETALRNEEGDPIGADETHGLLVLRAKLGEIANSIFSDEKRFVQEDQKLIDLQRVMGERLHELNSHMDALQKNLNALILIYSRQSSVAIQESDRVRIQDLVNRLNDQHNALNTFHSVVSVRLEMAKHTLSDAIALMFHTELYSVKLCQDMAVLEQAINKADALVKKGLTTGTGGFLGFGAKKFTFFKPQLEKLHKVHGTLDKWIDKFRGAEHRLNLNVDEGLLRKFSNWSAHQKRDHARAFFLGRAGAIAISLGQMTTAALGAESAIRAASFEISNVPLQSAAREALARGDIAAQQIVQAYGHGLAEAPLARFGFGTSAYGGREVGENVVLKAGSPAAQVEKVVESYQAIQFKGIGGSQFAKGMQKVGVSQDTIIEGILRSVNQGAVKKDVAKAMIKNAFGDKGWELALRINRLKALKAIQLW